MIDNMADIRIILLCFVYMGLSLTLVLYIKSFKMAMIYVVNKNKTSDRGVGVVTSFVGVIVAAG